MGSLRQGVSFTHESIGNSRSPETANERSSRRKTQRIDYILQQLRVDGLRWKSVQFCVPERAGFFRKKILVIAGTLA